MAHTLAWANITEETFIISRRLHNQFPTDTEFPQIDVLSDEFNEICAIIAKYDVQSHFQLRLLHRHTTIPKGHILLGTSITEPRGYWTRTVPVPHIDRQAIHPHIISVDAASCTTEDDKKNAPLSPSEFREDPPVSVRNIDSNFFTEFTNCLWKNGWENSLGLEVIQGQYGKMIEFSFDIGSLLVKDEDVNAEMREEKKGQFKLQETGWIVTAKGGTVCKTGETRCFTYPAPTGHIKVTDSKAKDVADIVKILREEGVLAM